MDAEDTTRWLLYVSLRHDCLRGNERCAAHTAFGRRFVYLPHVSHSRKDSVLDGNLAVSGAL